MSLEEKLLSLEKKLLATSDPGVLVEFYAPVQESLWVISKALDTLEEKGTDHSTEQQQIIDKIEEQVTESLQTISLWTECAEESIRTGNLIKWTHSSAFKVESEKVMKAVDEITMKINQSQSEYLAILEMNITPVKQKICLFMGIALESSKKNLVRIEIDGGISKSSLPNLRTIPWDYQERIDSMPTLDQFQTMESNVFWFSCTNEEPPQKCSVMQATGQPLTFFVASRAVDYVADTVLQAKVLYNGKWQLHESQCQGDYVMFQTDKMDAFFLLGTPREREFRIDPEGGQYVHRTDKRIRLEFPEGSVAEPQNFKITIFPVKVAEMAKRRRMFPDQYKFLSVTKGIHVTGNPFTKAVKVQLPLEEIENADQAEEDGDIEYVYFHIDGENVRRMTNQYIERSGDTIITDVETFSSFAGAKTRRGSVDSMSSMEVLISFGFRYHCKLMTFAKKLSEECVQIWCELVKKEEWRRLEEIRLEEHPSLQKLKDSDSKDIFIAERQRVRVDVKGNSFFGNEVPKNSLLITFFPIAEDNHIFPPLQKKIGMHGTPFSTVTYTMDKGRKTILHTLTFDPWTLPRVSKRNPSARSRSQPHTNPSSKRTEDTSFPKKGGSSSTKTEDKSSNRHTDGSSQGNDDKSTSTTRTTSKSSAKQMDESSSGNSQTPPLAQNLAEHLNISSPDPDRKQAQVPVSNKTKAFYSQHFEEFLADFGIDFVKEKCIENDIDNLDTFLLLEKEDMLKNLGLSIGHSLKCEKAKKEFLKLEK